MTNQPSDPLESALPDLLAFIRAHLGPGLRSRESSRDLLQSVCLEFLKRRPNFHPRDEEILRHWLFELAFRKIRDRARFQNAEKRSHKRERRLSSVDEMPDHNGHRTPSQDAIVREELMHVESAFQQLPEHYRQVILLAKVARQSHKQIAAELGRTEHACRMMLSRALARLSAHLEKAHGGDHDAS